MKEIAKFIKEGLKITSKTKIDKYNYHPKTEKELHYLIKPQHSNLFWNYL